MRRRNTWILILAFVLEICLARSAFSQTATVIRVNAGGGSYTDSAGQVWSADYGYNTGSIASTADSISGTADAPLYQSERWDAPASPELTYSFTVPNGSYIVNLHFAEIYKGAAKVGGRVFDVLINSQTVLGNFDIYSQVGYEVALIKSFYVTVSNGQINIQFLHQVENPKISAIEIIGQGSIVDTEPPSTPTDLSGEVVSSTEIDLNWSGSTDSGGSGLAGYRIYRDGAQVGTAATTDYADTGLSPETAYSYTVSAYDYAGNESPVSSAVTVTTLSASEVTIRVNAGGGGYTDSGGRVWSADYGYNTGSIASTADAISGTVADPLYQSERWDPPASPELTYSFTVPNGTYLVNLHFAEIYKGAAKVGGRVFDVAINDQVVLSNLDIYSEVGYEAALIKTFLVTVSNGQMKIQLLHKIENPKISAIEIIGQGSVVDTEPPSTPTDLSGEVVSSTEIDLSWSGSTDSGGSGLAGYRIFRDGAQVGTAATTGYADKGLSAATSYSYTVSAYDYAGNESPVSSAVTVTTLATSPVTVRVNAGGGSYADSGGRVWSADYGYNTGSIGTTADAISGTADDSLYQSERWDPPASPELTYSFTVPNGTYLVNLHFAEIYKGAAKVGGRVFDVAINDQVVLSNLDIYSEVGYEAALIKTFYATVSSGQINIKFLHEIENPKISAIEIISSTAPFLTISQPASNSFYSNTNLSVQANCANLEVGWSVVFVLDINTAQARTVQIPVTDISTTFYQTVFTNVAKGEHTLDGFVLDSSGVEQSLHAVKTGIVVGDYYVALGDSITKGSHDDVYSDNTSLDGRNTGGGYEPILNNLLTADKQYPQTVVNQGVSGDRSIDGVSKLPSILQAFPEAKYFLVQYGTNDAWAPTPSGLGLEPGDAGYPGSFKDNMQQIIDAIKPAGRIPYLAKVPYAPGESTNFNAMLQQYNQVIDELRQKNDITVIAPDFYCFFEAHPDQIADGIHPNGIGYQSMANIWFDTLLSQYSGCVQ